MLQLAVPCHPCLPAPLVSEFSAHSARAVLVPYRPYSYSVLAPGPTLGSSAAVLCQPLARQVEGRRVPGGC